MNLPIVKLRDFINQQYIYRSGAYNRSKKAQSNKEDYTFDTGKKWIKNIQYNLFE